eukprot:1158221-Pelagomonas_calceolata.AAC.9
MCVRATCARTHANQLSTNCPIDLKLHLEAVTLVITILDLQSICCCAPYSPHNRAPRKASAIRSCTARNTTYTHTLIHTPERGAPRDATEPWREWESSPGGWPCGSGAELSSGAMVAEEWEV